MWWSKNSLAHRDLRLTDNGTGGIFSGRMIDARRTESVYLRLALSEVCGPSAMPVRGGAPTGCQNRSMCLAFPVRLASVAAHMVHLISPAKPLADPKPQVPPRLAKALAALSKMHFPETTSEMPTSIPAGDVSLMRHMFTRCFLTVPKMVRYLGSFPKDLSVHT
jgi:hypothetical protein